MTTLHKYQMQMLLLRSRCWIWLWSLIVVLLLVPDIIVALKDVSVTIPQAVKRGSNALLICNYDMENDTLYSVKWYKGRREFYRYTPKENPAMKVFPVTSGLNVERNLSNQSHVVLLAVPLNISGKFTCEISVEAPSFQTAMVSGEMEVVELPIEQATVTGVQPRYRIGDLLDGNCSIKFSKPAANLTWTINGAVVPQHHIKFYHIEQHEDSNLESVVSEIHFMVTTQYFLKGQMRLKCTAMIFDIFKEEIESVIEEDRPRIMASGRSYDMNGYGYEQHGSGDGFEDHNESYLTYYSAAGSSASPTALPPLHGIHKQLAAKVQCILDLLKSLQQKLQLQHCIIIEGVRSITQKQIIGNDKSSMLMLFWQQLSLIFLVILLTQQVFSNLECQTKATHEVIVRTTVAKITGNTIGLRKSTLTAITNGKDAATATATATATASMIAALCIESKAIQTNRICRKCFYNCTKKCTTELLNSTTTEQGYFHFRCQYIKHIKQNQNSVVGRNDDNAATCQQQLQQQSTEQLSWTHVLSAIATLTAMPDFHTMFVGVATAALLAATTILAVALSCSECYFVKQLSADQRLLMTSLLQQQLNAGAVATAASSSASTSWSSPALALATC